MGDLLSELAAGARARSLNNLFSQGNYNSTKRKLRNLQVEFPDLLSVPPHNPHEHGHKKRQRSLRLAAALLTDDLEFKPDPAPNDPSGGNFRGWMRWLTWLGKLPPGAAQIEDNQHIVPNGTTLSPHDFIAGAISAALNEPSTKSIFFHWVSNTTGMIVRASFATSASGRRDYTIEVESLRASDHDVAIVDACDEDDYTPEP